MAFCKCSLDVKGAPPARPILNKMDPRATQMIEFLNRQILRDPDADLNEDTPLVSSGLVDSFALVEILTELERITQCRIPAGRVSPMDLNTVRQMLEVAARWGESRS